MSRSQSQRWCSLVSPAGAVALLLSLLTPALVASSAHAQAQGVRAETPEAMVERALDMREAGNDTGAHELIERAHRLSPTPRTAAQLGLVEQALGLFVLAEQHLTTALAAATDAWIRARRERLEQSLALVKARLGSVEILTNVPGAQVSIGGDVVGTTPLAAPVRVQIGTAAVEVTLAGYRSQNVSVLVTADSLSRQTVRLLPVPVDEPVAVGPTGPVRENGLGPVATPDPVDRSDDGGVFSQWWFWTIVAVVVVGAGVGLTVALTSTDTVTTASPIQGDEGGVITTLSATRW